MVNRIQEFQVTVPAGTSQVTPLTTALSFPEGILRRIDLTFPDGCLGLVGAQLAYAGVQLAPEGSGTFTRGNDKTWEWSLDGLPTGASWQLVTYNTDIYPHTLEIHFYVDELPLRSSDIGPLPPATVGTSTGGGAPTTGTGGDTGGGLGDTQPPGDTTPPDEGDQPPTGPPGGTEPPPEDNPPPPDTGGGVPPPVNPRGTKDMPGYVVHFASHSAYFGCYASGIVRVLSSYEVPVIQSAGVPVVQAVNQADFDRLKAEAVAAFGPVV